MITPDVIGTIPQWITAISSTTLAGALVTLIAKWWQRGISLKGLENADEADIRDHYADELRRLTDLVKEITKEHEECKRQREELRAAYNEIDRKLVGVTRQFVAFQLETAKAIPPENLTPSIRGMLEQLNALAAGNETTGK